MKDANDQTQDMYSEVKRRRGRPSTGQAKTAAQRMAEYRERRKHGETGEKGQGGERVLNTAMSTAAFLALEEQAKRNGVTKKERLELLLLSADETAAQPAQADPAAQQEIDELKERLATLQAQLDEAKEEARTLNVRAAAQSKQLKDQRTVNSNLKGQLTKLRNQSQMTSSALSLDLDQVTYIRTWLYIEQLRMEEHKKVCDSMDVVSADISNIETVNSILPIVENAWLDLLRNAA